MIYSVLEVYMEYKKNLKYFENKKLMLYGSAALLVLGLFLWFGPFWSRDNHYVMYIISVISIIAGGVIFAVTVSSRSSDKKIDEQVTEAFKLFDEETDEKFDLYERQLNYITPAEFEGYKYFEGSMLRRDRSGRYRTDVYVKNRVCFTADTLVIASRQISLICDETVDNSREIPYADIKSASAPDGVTAYGKVKIAYQNFTLQLNNGDVLVYQAKPSQAVDQLVSDVNHQIERHR